MLWTQLTSRGRQHSMLQLRGAVWRFAGLCCREQAVRCFTRGTTAASHHWTSADRAKRFGESSLFRNQFQKKPLNSGDVCRIIPLVFPGWLASMFVLFFSLSWDPHADWFTSMQWFPLQTSATHQVTESIHEWTERPQAQRVQQSVFLQPFI